MRFIFYMFMPFYIFLFFLSYLFFNLYYQVDMSKVKLDVLKPWITQKITEILNIEDDVVIDYVNNQLEEKVVTSIFYNSY